MRHPAGPWLVGGSQVVGGRRGGPRGGGLRAVRGDGVAERDQVGPVPGPPQATTRGAAVSAPVTSTSKVTGGAAGGSAAVGRGGAGRLPAAHVTVSSTRTTAVAGSSAVQAPTAVVAAATPVSGR